MKHEPIAISFNDKTYVKQGYEERISREYDIFRYLIRVEDIYDVSECDGSSFYIPCWQVDMLNGDYLRIENMRNLVVVYCKE